MTRDSGQAARPPVPRRNRKRWTIGGGIAASWLVLYVMEGSALGAALLLAGLAAGAAIVVLFLRFMGVTRDHPWLRRLASRPWRDGQDVLRVAMAHLHDVFVITPSGSLFAPGSVEIQMNPEDLVSLCDRMELGIVIASVTEVYEEQVVRYGARFARPGRAEVDVSADEWIPRGRYRLRQRRPVTAVDSASDAPDTSDTSDTSDTDMTDSGTWAWRGPGPATVMERTATFAPVLRLVTGGWQVQTQMTGARAGRGSVELVLPDVPTISREHARFAFAEGRWRVTNLGINGLTVNGTAAGTEHPLSDGDTIGWGTRPDAVVSRVEIG